ncbi:polycystic kidney disease protein 1-like 2 [Branchiostoma floridae]|uniref:Polycystic kidney disease protein 1-like 2 n=1 Tax=Branchiostoma floridae TaxID=7739 RepID=A0A9J7KI81_BRAFL|nr:polycystic kidney disease protein 1-like 2 [Branchiostoma floridae]
MRITASKCLFFDESSSLWTDRGCEVGPQTTDEQLHCICDHLTAFAGFVAPNPLDLGSSFTFDLDRSLIALVTVCVVMALYILAVFIGRSLDVDDKRKREYRRQRKRENRVQQHSVYKNVPQSTTGRSFLSEHLWISAVNPPSNHFTRVQRISCCLSLLMSFMLVNIMFYRGDRNFVPRVTGGRVQLEQLFSWDTFIIGLESSLIALPINVIVVVLFRYAGPRHDTSSSANGLNRKGKENLEKFKKEGALKKSEDRHGIEKHGAKVAVSEKPYRPLSWWSVIVAWFLVPAIVIVSGAFTVLYGNDYGRAKSQAWLFAFLISFLTDFILLQPVKIILVIIFFKLVTKRTQDREASQRSGTGSDVYYSYPMEPLPVPPPPVQPSGHYQELRPAVYQSLQRHQRTVPQPLNSTRDRSAFTISHNFFT